MTILMNKSWWRITKYNPMYRDTHDRYTKDEWTSASDIGKEYNGNIFDSNQYMEIENAYIKTIQLFLDYLSITTLCITQLEKKRIHKNTQLSCPSNFITTYKRIKAGMCVTMPTIEIIAQLALREDVWCKLESDALCVHFGYDYYMYIGCTSPCNDLIKKIETLGLFAESCESSPWSNE